MAAPVRAAHAALPGDRRSLLVEPIDGVEVLRLPPAGDVRGGSDRIEAEHRNASLPTRSDLAPRIRASGLWVALQRKDLDSALGDRRRRDGLRDRDCADVETLTPVETTDCLAEPLLSGGLTGPKR
jgi:hypothetical protein